MSKKESDETKADESQPQPGEAFGHPIAREASRDQSSKHGPGYDDSTRPAKASNSGAKAVGAIVPPRKADKLPRVGLAEKIRQRLSEDKEEQ
jgi:hypothetical protein